MDIGKFHCFKVKSIQSVIKCYRSRHLQISNGKSPSMNSILGNIETTSDISDSVNFCCFCNINFRHGKHLCVECLQIHEMKIAVWGISEVRQSMHSRLDKNHFKKSYNTFVETMNFFRNQIDFCSYANASMESIVCVWLKNLILYNKFDAWTPSNLIFSNSCEKFKDADSRFTCWHSIVLQ